VCYCPQFQETWAFSTNFAENSCTKFHEDVVHCSVADEKSQMEKYTEGRTDRSDLQRSVFLIRKRTYKIAHLNSCVCSLYYFYEEFSTLSSCHCQLLALCMLHRQNVWRITFKILHEKMKETSGFCYEVSFMIRGDMWFSLICFYNHKIRPRQFFCPFFKISVNNRNENTKVVLIWGYFQILESCK
jgi:hypothetical protein